MNHFPIICMIGSAMVLYFIGALLYSGGLFSRMRFHGRYASLATALGFVSHTGAIVDYCLKTRSVAALYAQLFGTFLFFGWVLVGAYLLVEWRLKSKALGAFALPVGIFTMLVGTAIPTHSPDGVAGALQAPVIVLHVLAILVGYASFAVAFAAAALYLVEHRMLKKKRLGGVFERLPSLDRSDNLASRMVLFGYPALTLGLALGIFRAEMATGHAWVTDPKVVSSLLVWVVYGIYLVSRNLLGWTGRKTNYLLIAGFALIVIAYAGGLALSPGLHGVRFLEQGRHL